MSLRFKIVVPSYNSVKWIKKTLNSIVNQTYPYFDVCVIDDASTEVKQWDIIQKYSSKNGWQAVRRKHNVGALENIVMGISMLDPDDEDVILLLDGDDWFYNRNVLSKLAEAYNDPSTLMTYGQFLIYPRWKVGFCYEIPPEWLEKKNFRQQEFIFSHLRSFKFKLWKQIREEDLKDSQGNYYRSGWDLAIIYPLLEMTGGMGCKFIPNFLYVYNMDNPINDCVIRREEQANSAKEIRGKQPYPQLYFFIPSTHSKPILTPLRNGWTRLFLCMTTPRTYQIAFNKLIKMIFRCF